MKTLYFQQTISCLLLIAGKTVDAMENKKHLLRQRHWLYIHHTVITSTRWDKHVRLTRDYCSNISYQPLNRIVKTVISMYVILAVGHKPDDTWKKSSLDQQSHSYLQSNMNSWANFHVIRYSFWYISVHIRVGEQFHLQLSVHDLKGVSGNEIKIKYIMVLQLYFYKNKYIC